MVSRRAFMSGGVVAALIWACAPAGAQPAPTSSRPAIESTLAAMQRAVLAADEGEFLSHIDPTEPRFAQEMKHWAEDLKKRTPFELAMTIEDEGASFEEARAQFRLTLAWRIALDQNGHEIPQDKAWIRKATFPPVVFTRAPDGRWLFQGEVWQVLEGDGFVVKYLPGDEAVAETVRKVFPVARKHVDQGFEIPGSPPQILKLYADMDHLKATVYLSMPDPYLGGWNESGESIKFMRSYTTGEKHWTRAYAHEYGHVATWEMGPRARDLPWWVQEGVAELAAEEYDPPDQNQREMTRWATRHGAVPWDEISDYDTTEQRYKHMAYVQGHHFMGYISGRFGRAKRNQWLRALASGVAMNDACTRVFGEPFEPISWAWKVTLPMPAERPPQEAPE